MKNAGLYGVCALAAAVFFSCTVNKPAEQPKFITVNAAAAVTEKADIIEVAFSVGSAGWAAKKVMEDNDAAVSRLMEAMRLLDVEPDAVTVSNTSFEPYKLDPRQYAASTTVTVRLKSANRIGDIIDNGKTAGMPIPVVRLAISETAEAYRKARAAAVQQAQEKAALLAGAGGCRIGDVLSIEELSKGDGEAPKPDNNGNVCIASELRVTFAIQP